jgi:hypothetical protein
MINNTSLQRWQRAAARHLDTQFINEIMQGMNCSLFEAQAIRDKVHEVYMPLMEMSGTIKPGQIQITVIDTSVAPNIPLAQAKQRLVILTLDAGQEDRDVRRQGGVCQLRRHRLSRICEEAFQQGGLLTLEAIADLFNCAVRTLVNDLAILRAQQVIPPLRSTIKDMGRAVTHRKLIVEKWLAGHEYSEIARITYHSISSVANYVEKFKRCCILLDAGFDLDTVALIARVSPALVRAFQEIAANAQPVLHRREQIENNAKKNSVQDMSRGCR